MDQSAKVAIIGAGPAGLMAAKHALQSGFKPVVYEKSAEVGGVWSRSNGAVWNTMTTNLSKHTCSFKGHDWPHATPTFPSSAQMTQYVQAYAVKFNLHEHIKFSSEIKSVQKKEDCYEIQVAGPNSCYRQNFKFVIVASGIFLNPNIPQIPGIQSFPGSVIHSKQYKDGSLFKEKKVLVIGGSFSAIELIGDLSKYSQTLVHSFHRPFWVLPHYLPCGPTVDGKTPKLPIDFFYNRKFYKFLGKESKEESCMKKNMFYSQLCIEQQINPKLMVSKEYWNQSVYIGISSSYMEGVREGRIKPRNCDVKRILGSVVELKDGSQEEVEAIVLCTGYKSSLSFLSEEIKEVIKFDEKDRLQPVILYKQTYHPELDNMFFIGVYKGPYFAVLELQVELAFDHFLKQSRLPCLEEIQKGLQGELEIRNQKIREQFPHADYVKFCDEIAELKHKGMKVKQFLTCKETEPELKQRFLQMNVFPNLKNAFTLTNMLSQIQESASIMKGELIYE